MGIAVHAGDATGSDPAGPRQPPDARLAAALRKRLLIWYRRSGRDLPWRRTRDPYPIWVSEIMLQQTRVETVIPYYERFMGRFPSVETLACASLEDVLGVWGNMGYYARARNLHAAARELLQHADARLPGSLQALLQLPGIGAYTAGAILSLAFQQPYPAVDGNVRRVLSRLFAVEKPVDRGEGRAQVECIAAGLVPRTHPGDHNQALMELGALVCRPRQPECAACPLRVLCRAQAEGRQAELPVRRVRRPVPHREFTAALIRDGRRRLLVVRRATNGFLGGLWKFPGGERKTGESLRRAVIRTVREELGLIVRPGGAMPSIDHAYTHFRMTLHVFPCTTEGPPVLPERPVCRWIGNEDLKDCPLSRAENKVLEESRQWGD